VQWYITIEFLSSKEKIKEEEVDGHYRDKKES